MTGDCAATSGVATAAAGPVVSKDRMPAGEYPNQANCGWRAANMSHIVWRGTGDASATCRLQRQRPQVTREVAANDREAAPLCRPCFIARLPCHLPFAAHLPGLTEGACGAEAVGRGPGGDRRCALAVAAQGLRLRARGGSVRGVDRVDQDVTDVGVGVRLQTKKGVPGSGAKVEALDSQECAKP